MMNNQVRIDPEVHAFITQDRIRLFTERNNFKALAEEKEHELYHTKNRSSQVISLLLAVISVLIGVLSYVVHNT